MAVGRERIPRRKLQCPGWQEPPNSLILVRSPTKIDVFSLSAGFPHARSGCVPGCYPAAARRNKRFFEEVLNGLQPTARVPGDVLEIPAQRLAALKGCHEKAPVLSELQSPANFLVVFMKMKPMRF